MIQRFQYDYYRTFGEADRASVCSGFILLMLDAIDDALVQALEAEDGSETLVKTPVKTPVKMRVKTQDQLPAVLATQPGVTLAEAATHLGKSVSAIERAVRRLRDSGRLRYVGPPKGGHWEVMEQGARAGLNALPLRMASQPKHARCKAWMQGDRST